MKIKPIKDLRDTNEISKQCNELDEPIFITKNGYEDLVIMSNKHYETISKRNLVNSNSNSYINTFHINKNKAINGFVKVGMANIDIKVSDCFCNTKQIKLVIDEGLDKGVSLLIFQELTLSGYTCRDLFLNKTLQDNIERCLEEIIDYSKNKNIIIVLGSPILVSNKLISASLVIQEGQILGVIPKTHYDGIDERSFTSCLNENRNIQIGNHTTLLSKDTIFKNNNDDRFSFAIEVGNDILKHDSSVFKFIKNGASLIINPSADISLVDEDENKKALLKGLSKMGKCALINVNAGRGESTTDYVLSGNNLVYECGNCLLDKDSLTSSSLEIIDIDLEIIQNQRNNVSYHNENINVIGFNLFNEHKVINRLYSTFPFLYFDKDAKDKYLKIIKTQALGLIKRMEASYSKKIVLALSGGLDSTLALLVAYEAFKMSNRDLKDIIAITLPCFGTSTRTHDNALKLATILGVTFKEINIKESVLNHFKDIGHDENDYSATYENAQARERTQVAMDYANKVNGLMLGTGDLSELCLGWATYNGDHMSMYGVNASIPKTLVQALTKTFALEHLETREVLEDIIGTPISPELLPLKDGEIAQKTEEKVGPYELIDFYIYHLLVNHFSLEKIVLIAKEAFKNKYDEETIKKWLSSFVKRFYASQFKRSCLPDGPKVTCVSVSPRNGLYMPSDGSNGSMVL